MDIVQVKSNRFPGLAEMQALGILAVRFGGLGYGKWRVLIHRWLDATGKRCPILEVHVVEPTGRRSLLVKIPILPGMKLTEVKLP